MTDVKGCWYVENGKKAFCRWCEPWVCTHPEARGIVIETAPGAYPPTCPLALASDPVKVALHVAEKRLNTGAEKLQERIAAWKQIRKRAETDAQREKCSAVIFAYTEGLQWMDSVGAAYERAMEALKEKE